jgi:actin-like ATPase involved in cell morphogenesis
MSKNAQEKILKPGVGVDVGTANIVVTRQYEDGSYEVKHHRNMLFKVEDAEDMSMLLSNALSVKVGGKTFVVGQDALSLVNALGAGQLIRPMKDGLLNPSVGEAEELLFHILQAVVGAPLKEGEKLRFSVPANPIDRPEENNFFHEQVLNEFFKGAGYDAKGVNEAAAVVYSDGISMEDPDQGVFPLTGIGISWGAGMANAAAVLKGKPVVTISNTRCGDYIDQQVARVTQKPIAQIIKIKERQLDLESVDESDRTIKALSIFYDEVINRIGKGLIKSFTESGTKFDGPVIIVNAGGTSMPKGFDVRLKKVLSGLEMPFQVKDVIMSKTPFFAVSRGSCLAAQ